MIVGAVYHDTSTTTAIAGMTVEANAQKAALAWVADIPAGAAGPWTATLGANANVGGVALAVSPISTPAAPDILGVAHWKSLFDGQESSTWATASSQSTSGDSWQHYNMAYYVDAYGAMYEATSDTFYLDRVLTILENVQASAVVSSSLSGTNSQFQDSYLTWPGLTHPSNSPGEYPLYEFFMWRYGFRALRLADAAGGAFATRAATILSFAEVNVWEKWWQRGVNSYIYREATHMNSHAVFIAHQLEALSSDGTRLTQARTVIDNHDYAGVPGQSGGGHSFRNQLRDNSADAAAYEWDWDWAGTEIQDVSHGGADAGYVSEAFDRDTYWAQADLDRLCLTLTNVIMPGGGGSGSANIDGTGNGTGWIADGWSKLGRHSVATQQALEAWGTQGQAQYMAQMAVSAGRWGVA
jgi:hypothetical protein